MENQVSVYYFDEREVRVITDENGDPWWVAKDVAAILEYRDAYNLARRLDDDEKGTLSASTLRGNQEVVIINEFGLYNAILGSQKPQARKFKRWVTHEVLPSIRKTGRYSAATTGELRLSRADDDGLTPAARARLFQLAILLADKDEAFIQRVNLCYIDPKAEIPKDDLYTEYSDNAAIHGMEPMFRNLFFRQLYDNTEVCAFYSNRGGVRKHMVRGIGLVREREEGESPPAPLFQRGEKVESVFQRGEKVESVFQRGEDNKERRTL